MEVQVCKYEDANISEIMKEVCEILEVSYDDEALACEYKADLYRLIDSNEIVFIKNSLTSDTGVPIHAIVLTAIEVFLDKYYGSIIPKKLHRVSANHARKVEPNDSPSCKLDVLQSLWR